MYLAVVSIAFALFCLLESKRLLFEFLRLEHRTMGGFLCNHKFAHVDAFSQNEPCHVTMMTTFSPAPFPTWNKSPLYFSVSNFAF